MRCSKILWSVCGSSFYEVFKSVLVSPGHLLCFFYSDCKLWRWWVLLWLSTSHQTKDYRDVPWDKSQGGQYFIFLRKCFPFFSLHSWLIFVQKQNEQHLNITIMILVFLRWFSCQSLQLIETVKIKRFVWYNVFFHSNWTALRNLCENTFNVIVIRVI